MAVFDLLNLITGNHVHARGRQPNGSGSQEVAALETQVTGMDLFSSAANLGVSASYDTSAGLSAPFTETLIDGRGYKRLVGKVEANTAITVTISQSDDGVLWDAIPQAAWDVANGFTAGATAAGVVGYYSVQLFARYVKVVHANGGVATTNFRASGRLASI